MALVAEMARVKSVCDAFGQRRVQFFDRVGDAEAPGSAIKFLHAFEIGDDPLQRSAAGAGFDAITRLLDGPGQHENKIQARLLRILNRVRELVDQHIEARLSGADEFCGDTLLAGRSPVLRELTGFGFQVAGQKQQICPAALGVFSGKHFQNEGSIGLLDAGIAFVAKQQVLQSEQPLGIAVEFSHKRLANYVRPLNLAANLGIRNPRVVKRRGVFTIHHRPDLKTAQVVRGRAYSSPGLAGFVE